MKAETQVHGCQNGFFESNPSPNFYLKSPCFLTLTTNSNLQDCMSQSKHIWRLDLVHKPSVSNLCRKKKNTWFFQYSSNSGVQSTPKLPGTQCHVQICSKNINIHLKPLTAEGKQEENDLALHQLKRSICTTSNRNGFFQWKQTLGNGFS